MRPRNRGAAVAFALLAATAHAQLSIDTTRTFDAGLDHNVAVITSGANAGQVWAWGGNENGKLGNGSTSHSSVPVRVGKNTAGFTNIVAVAASHANSYAIGSDGKLWAWGDHQAGVSGSRLGLASGTSLETCTVNGSSTACARSPRAVPVPGTPGAGGTQKVVQVGGGWGRAVALREDGTVWEWGSTFTPTQVSGLTDVTQIAVGYFFTVALKSDGTLAAWGSGGLGQLGNGGTSGSSTPVAVSTLTGVVAIRARGAFTLALKNDGTLWAWGSDAYGQIGNDTALDDVLSPVQVMSGVNLFEAGYSTAFARKTDGTVWAWGLNNHGQLHAATSPQNACNGRTCEPTPRQLSSTFNGAIRIVGGGGHTAIVKPDQSIALAGTNNAGQLAVSGDFTQSVGFSHFDPAFTMTPAPAGGASSSVGARARVSGLSLLALGAGIDFGDQAVGGSSAPQIVAFENLDTSASISVSSVAAPSGFTLSSDGCSGTSVASNTYCTFEVAFAPSGAGAASGTLTINSDAADNGVAEVVLAGNGIAVPGAPLNVVAAAGDSQATVSFAAPTSDGGSAITSYTATASPGGATASGSASPITVAALANGTAYTFTVTATNAAGTGPSSAPSNSVTPQAAGFALNVSKAGGGSGTVTSSPPGITCGSTCSAAFAGGSSVSLSAGADPGSKFGGWSGDCTGSGACSVTMSSARSVTATFQACLALTTSTTGTGSGSFSINVNAADFCSDRSFVQGSTVQVSPNPATGSYFAGWSGACSGTATPCSVTMDQARSLTAHFIARRSTDMNGDGRSDILYRNDATGQLYRFFVNGIALSGGAMAYTEPNTAWRIVADADFNADGVADLVWRNTATGQLYMMFFASSGLPAGGSVFYVEPNANWKIVHTPDLDGDARADLLWWNASTGQVYAMLMNGAAIVAQGLVYTEPNTQWRIVAAGDFQASGKHNQLLWRNQGTGQVYMMSVGYIAGSITPFTVTGQIVYTEPNTAWKIVAAADFDGDGRSDILWRNDSTGHVYMMLMQLHTIAGQGMAYHEPNLAWKVVATGDYNGDGKADLLWRNDATGQVYMMLMNGISIAAQGMVYHEPNTSWKILGPAYYAVP